MASDRGKLVMVSESFGANPQNWYAQPDGTFRGISIRNEVIDYSRGKEIHELHGELMQRKNMNSMPQPVTRSTTLVLLKDGKPWKKTATDKGKYCFKVKLGEGSHSLEVIERID